MLDKVLGILAIAILMGFMGILIGFVPDVDLIIVAVVVVVMAAYDFYRTLFKRSNGGR
ncbi:MAG: hypothetical protein Tsb0032_31270 [Kiloniellaceae bacterium]